MRSLVQPLHLLFRLFFPLLVIGTAISFPAGALDHSPERAGDHAGPGRIVRLNSPWEYWYASGMEDLRRVAGTEFPSSGSGTTREAARGDGTDRFLALRITLPQRVGHAASDPWVHPAVYIDRLFMHGEVYLGDRLIYSAGNPDGDGDEQFPEKQWHVIALPDDWPGRELTILVRSDLPVVGLRGPVLLGERDDLFRRLVVRDLLPLVLSILLLAASLLTVGIAAFLRIGPRRLNARLSGITLLEIGAALYLLTVTSVKSVLIANQLFWLYLWLGASAAMVIGILLHLRERVPGRVSRFLPIAAGVHAAVTGVAIGAFLVGQYRLGISIAAGRIVLYGLETALVIPVVVTGIREGRIRAHIRASIFLAIAIAGILYIMITGEYTRYHGTGNLVALEVLVVSIGALLIRRVYRAVRIAARYQSDIARARGEARGRVYADIHDHLGANLNDLAIRAERSGDVTTARDVRGALNLLRGTLTEQEDLATMEEDLLLGIRLHLVRRYSGAGRTVRIELPEENPFAAVRRDSSFRDFAHRFQPILTELVTNDLKYGYGTSTWTFQMEESPGGTQYLAVTIAAPTHYESFGSHENRPGGGRGTGILINRIREMNGQLLQGPEVTAPAQFHFSFKVPVPPASDFYL